MKKVLMLVISFFILVPAFKVFAAYVYVPNFYNITSNKFEERVRFNGMEQESYQGVNYTAGIIKLLMEKPVHMLTDL